MGASARQILSTDREFEAASDHHDDNVYARPASELDLGVEPPLDPAGLAASPVDRRAISFRWLTGSVLTGLSGALLLGGAIHVSLQSDGLVARNPEAAQSTARAVSPQQAGARKGDKLVRNETVVTAKQNFRAPMTLRAGNREIIRVRPFVRVSTGLAMSTGVYATDIPRFNPLRLFAEGSDTPEIVAAAENPADIPDADVSVLKRDLAVINAEADKLALTDADVIAQIEDERRNASGGSGSPSLPIPAQLLLSRAVQSGAVDALGYASAVDAPFSSIEVRVVPENVTVFAKAEPGTTPLVEDINTQLKRGETLDQLLKSHGATDSQIQDIAIALGGRAKVNALQEGQAVQLLVAPGPRTGDPRMVSRVVLYGERGVEGIAAMDDVRRFVAVTPQADPDRQNTSVAGAEDGEDREGAGPRLYDSLYETALKHHLPRATVEEMVRIFSYDVDFQRRVAPGDQFDVFLAEDEDSGNKVEMLYASLTIGGETRSVYRFVSPEDNSIDYFDSEGRSLKKFLLRKPIAEGEMRSGFGMRRHPILGYYKMHTGVDWSNRIGTPIVSSGNGTIIKAEWDSGYGRRIEVQHANGYVTAYSHLSSFARGIQPGVRVKQGQVIGYLGNTGLSTGPHLHYEVLVNGHFVNPLRIKVPRGRELDGRALAEFKRQREQIEALASRAGAGPRLAQSNGT